MTTLSPFEYRHEMFTVEGRLAEALLTQVSTAVEGARTIALQQLAKNAPDGFLALDEDDGGVLIRAIPRPDTERAKREGVLAFVASLGATPEAAPGELEGILRLVAEKLGRGRPWYGLGPCPLSLVRLLPSSERTLGTMDHDGIELDVVAGDDLREMLDVLTLILDNDAFSDHVEDAWPEYADAALTELEVSDQDEAIERRVAAWVTEHRARLAAMAVHVREAHEHEGAIVSLAYMEVE